MTGESDFEKMKRKIERLIMLMNRSVDRKAEENSVTLFDEKLMFIENTRRHVLFSEDEAEAAEEEEEKKSFYFLRFLQKKQNLLITHFLLSLCSIKVRPEKKRTDRIIL